MDVALLMALLAIFLIITLPIGISLGLATAVTMCVFSSTPLTMIAQNAFTGIDTFPLLAIPFFMLAGSMMSYGGISRRIVSFAESLVGFMIGALAMVTVVACMFFAAISGSGPATVSAIGSFMIPAMKEKHYGGPFAAALSAAAGSIGVIIPPSIPFVIYGVVSGASVGEMFMAGVIPGLMIGFSLMVYAHFVAKKRNYPCSDKQMGLRNLLLSFKDAFWALMVPVIILGGIYGGIFTPTEAAVVGVVYAMLVGKFIYKELDFRTLCDALKDTVVVNGATTFMLGLSMAFAKYLTMEEIPIKIGAWIVGISDSKYVILLLVDIMLLIIGCFIDNISSMIILTPIFLPVMKDLGVDPVHFGLVMTVALAIGFITPPYGANLFVASAVSGERMDNISKEIFPLVGVMTVCLMLFTYFPAISMTLVNFFMR
ncbi:MAG: TRAP transporter large permease [Synergistaceae bacterium]|jgi:C4-dicarboxylate transporter DctM subunit|nr:TRAP transporter large permease [Synergistaceae bacterium]